MSEPTTQAPEPGPDAPAARRRRLGRGSVAVIAATAGVLATLGITTLVHQSDDGPQDVVRAYVQALNEERFEDALALVEDRKGIDAAHIVKVGAQPLSYRVESSSSSAGYGSVTLAPLVKTDESPDEEYISLTHTQHGWRLAEPELLTTYELEPVGQGTDTNALRTLADVTLLTHDEKTVPDKGWAVKSPLLAGEQRGSAQVQLPGTGSPQTIGMTFTPGSSDGSAHLDVDSLDLSVLAHRVQTMLRATMVVRSYYDGGTAGPMLQDFAINRVPNCRLLGFDSSDRHPVAGLGVLRCAVERSLLDSHGKPRMDNPYQVSSAEQRVERGGHTCFVKEPKPAQNDFGSLSSDGYTVDVSVNDTKVMVDWTRDLSGEVPQPLLVVGDDEELTRECEPFAGLEDTYRNRPVAGVVPRDPKATTQTAVSFPLDSTTTPQETSR